MAFNEVKGVDRLYIGGLFALKRKQTLQDLGITHILSVLQLGKNTSVFSGYQHLAIDIDDVEDEDLLQYFPQTNKFIGDALTSGGTVFVHCAVGKSRSASCVIAYMMSTLGLTPYAALAQLRETRSFVEPNPGFWEQLKLYHSMGCPSTPLDDVAAYQRWAYQREVAMSVACGRAPEKLRFADEVGDVDEKGNTVDTELRCRKCRRVVATTTFIIPHDPVDNRKEDLDDYLLNNHSPIPDPMSLPPISEFPQTATVSSTLSSKACAHAFVHPLLWMKNTLERGELEGRLNCPNARCGQVLGKYAWQGMPCSCGRWVTPAFAVTKSRVDQIRTRTAKASASASQPATSEAIDVQIKSPASSESVTEEITIPTDAPERKRDESL